MIELTDRQSLMLELIAKHIRKYLFPPTLREIGKMMDIESTNGVRDHLIALERKGYFIFNSFKSRGITLSQKSLNIYGLNFCDRCVDSIKDECDRLRIICDNLQAKLEEIETYCSDANVFKRVMEKDKGPAEVCQHICGIIRDKEDIMESLPEETNDFV